MLEWQYGGYQIDVRLSTEHTMFKNIDLYLGAFLILCGFIISLINLRSILVRKCKYSSVLLSENIILMCIGITFISRAVYSLKPENVHNMELRTANIKDNMTQKCGFSTLLLSYGPLIVSMVNSFLSLIIDNYMHYQMIVDIKEKDEQNNVQDVNLNSMEQRMTNLRAAISFFKHNFSYITIAFQWIIPIIIALSMYSMKVKKISMNDARELEETCMTMLDVSNTNCLQPIGHNDTIAFIQSTLNHLEAYESGEHKKNSSAEIESILDNVFTIIKNYNNDSDFRYTSPIKLSRKPKYVNNCVELCIIDSKSMLVYLFLLAFLCYFLPITISTIILTKISILKTNKPHLKTYVTRELLYNVLFWTPIVFDTFLSLILCSFSMYGVRTSLFHIVANIYQAVRNFMNTKYFRENVIFPV